MEHTPSSPVDDGDSSVDDDSTGAERNPWEFAYREALKPYMLKRALFAVGLCLGVYAAAGPLSTSDLTWAERLAFSILCAVLCAPPCYAEYVITLYLARFQTPGFIALAVAAAALVAALPATAVVYGAGTLFRPDGPAQGLSAVYLSITLVLLLYGAVAHYLMDLRLNNRSPGGPGTVAEPASPEVSERSATAPATERGEPAGLPSRFLDRLPPEVGRDVIYLKMSDHYVEVVTTAGRCNLLMRFADAVAELGDSGVRVHRSYWVAYPHVERWARRNHRTLLRLSGEHLVPVSRTHLDGARAALARHGVGADPRSQGALDSRRGPSL